MNAMLDAALADTFDLAIIGGGINGVAIARDAALRGMRVILLEKDDFGSGASSKTSKLAHGGLRYLENFQFGLVRESLRERALLLKNAPHLVRPLSFIFPVYEGDPKPLWQVNIGLYLYDYLGGFNALPKHEKWSPQKILECFPKIKRQHLHGGCLYSDASMLDGRLVIENMLAAEQAGATIVNQAEVVRLSKTNGCIDGVIFRHPSSEKEFAVKANVVVNATGAWSNHIADMEPDSSHCRVEPTKGVHIVLPKLTDNNIALILHAPQDGRIFFILPWESFSLVGTTDTFFDENPDRVSTEKRDIQYLLAALHHYFPDHQLSESSIVTTFAGLRPLVAPTQEKSPSDINRNHVIHTSKGGMITVLGGKYTTHRKVAEDLVDMIADRLKTTHYFLPCATEKVQLPGASGPYSLLVVAERLRDYGLLEAQVNHLISHYGTNSLQILDIILSRPEEAEQICPSHPHILAEVTYAITVEHAKKLEDWFFRRTSIAYTTCKGKLCLNKIATIFASLLHWSNTQKMMAISKYLELIS